MFYFSQKIQLYSLVFVYCERSDWWMHQMVSMVLEPLINL